MATVTTITDGSEGDLAQIKRKKQSSFDITNTPLDKNGLRPSRLEDAMPGSARAQQMQQQYQQPVVKGTPQGNGLGSGLANLGNGIVNTAVGAAESLLAAPFDLARNSATRLVGGDPASLPGGETAFRDTASNRLNRGLDQLSTTGDHLSSAGRSLLGASRLEDGWLLSQQQQSPTASMMPAATSPQANQAPARKSSLRDANLYHNTSVDGIVGRVNANGVTEFSNAPADRQQAASLESLRPGGPLQKPAPSSLNSLMPGGPDAPSGNGSFASLGSTQNLGNGVGTFSQMDPGTSQLAIQRFERANQIRRDQANQSRLEDALLRQDLANSVTIVRDSSTAEGRRLAKSDLRRDALMSTQLQANVDAAQGVITNERARRTGALEEDTKTLELQSRQRIAQLQALVADERVPQAQRERGQQLLDALRGPDKNQYQAIQTIIGTDAMGQPIVGRDVVDTRNNRLLGQSLMQQGGGIAADARAIAIRDNASLTREQKVAQLRALGYSQ
ncbi:hypothetical protein [Pseudomonas sp. LRF_L74]|uniref:hypothetical protein n=1 Tax=Pseudomonas sp. LRF_L74 TaxID=3369422 RepID=UPI003F603E6C